jgi:hypothetical protein
MSDVRISIAVIRGCIETAIAVGVGETAEGFLNRALFECEQLAPTENSDPRFADRRGQKKPHKPT